MPVFNGKTTTMVWIPDSTSSWDDRWRLRIQDPAKPDDLYWVEVPQPTFDSTATGQCFDTKAERTVELECERAKSEDE